MSDRERAGQRLLGDGDSRAPRQREARADLSRRQWMGRALGVTGAAVTVLGSAREALANGTPASDAVAHGVAPSRTPADILEIVGPWEIGGLSAAQSGHLYLRLQVAETLLDAGADGSPRPGLATAWEVREEGLVWRFQLRPDARFHDGQAVTAESTLMSLRAAQVAPSLLSQAPIASISAEGARTVVIRLTRPFAALASLLAHASTVILAPSSFDADGRGIRQIIGSGPYRIAQLQPPQRMETVWHEQHGGAAPAIRAVRYLSVGRAETRALMAASGQADLVFTLDPASVVRLRRTPGRHRLISVMLPRVMMLKLNAGHPSLRDGRVRQALSLAIDRTGIARAVLREPALAASELFPPTAPAWHTASEAPLHRDLHRARQLLSEAGWHEAEGRWRDASGQLVALTLRTFPDRPELPIVATALQAQWRQLGIPVRVAVGNSGDIPLGHRDGTLQLGLLARNYATAPDPTPTLAADFSPQGADWGAMGWHDARVSEALAALSRGGLTETQAVQARRQAMAVIQSELPVIPVAWYRLHVALSDRVTGVQLDPFERHYRIDQMRWARPGDTL